MKRKRLDESSNPIDPYPFEAYWWDSWHPVERLRIKDGRIFMHLVTDNGGLIEEMIPMSNLRMRSRKANVNDCACILRPGVDVCVLTTPSSSSSDDDDDDDEDDDKPPVWVDARIRSIERKPHDSICNCQFFVSFYVMEGSPMTVTKKLRKETTLVNQDQLLILQKLEQIPCEDQHYRWSTCEDCSSLLKFKLFTGKFCADLSWLVATSVLKQTIFDVRSIQNQMVYEIADVDGSTSLSDSGNCSYSVNFKVDNDILSPVIVKFVPGMRSYPEVHDPEQTPINRLISLRRSKRRFMQPERYLGCDAPEFEVEITQLGERKFCKWESSDDDEEYEKLPLALSIQADHEHQKTGEVRSSKRSGERRSKDDSIDKDAKSTASEMTESPAVREKKQSHHSQLALMPQSLSSEGKLILRGLDAPPDETPGDYTGNIDLISKYLYENGSKKVPKKKIAQPIFMRNERGCLVPRFRKAYKRKAFCVRSEWESIYDMKPSGKKSLTAAACRELLTRCMQNIDATMNIEQPPIIDQWKEFQSMKFEDKKEEKEKATEDTTEEISEIDMLWKEMELALASYYFLDDNENSSAVPKPADEDDENTCRHDYRLNEEIGVICRLCGFVLTEIKDVSPPFWSPPNSSANKEQKTEENPEQKPYAAGSSLDDFHVPTSSNKAPSKVSEGEENVWALIPDLRDKLRVHQRRAFEFLWRNTAGSLVPAQMDEKSKKRGGCVISHTPGAGKTLLIITFLVSYLKLFPGSRPLVLAPKTTLYTWYKEIIKWKIPIPVYQIHGGQTYKGEVLRQRMRLSSGLPRNQDFMHVLDCLEKMQKWLAHPSVLLMGYTSFLTLTREGSNYAHRKYMNQVLRECPGIMILDEGHNPRSTKSRLRKALMKVNTKLRVLLSGTLFQNNFGEYFNTLCLARPVFIKEVLKELDPRHKKNKKDGAKNRFSRENRARKIFIDKMSRMIDSSVPEERLEGLNILKNLTGGFIDVYEGGSAENLPGLQCYTLMMKPTPLQHDILVKLQDQRPVYKGFPLELELLITLAAIHPWLIRTTSCSNQYFSPEELEDLGKTKFDVKFGSKVRFIMSLIPKCVFRKEKLLIFCHNIAPINLLLDLFAAIFNWRKGREILVLQGDIELFERGRVMDKFEEPGGPSKIMLASITACAEGISLTAASRVILLDSEWNPSKSKQAIARAFRPGQDKVVYVYQLLAAGTLEEEKYSRTTWKEWVSSMIFSEELVEDPSHWQAPNIEDELLREIVEDDRATLFHRIMKIEKASSVIRDSEVKNNSSNIIETNSVK